MRKIKAFFYIAYKSVASFKYYKEILQTPFEFSLKYYAVLVIIAALITSAGTYFIEGPKAKEVLNNTLSQIETTYPNELVVTIKEGQWEVNQPLPLVIPFPEAYKPQEGEEIPFENLVVFDKDGEIGDLDEYKTAVLVNEKNMLIKQAGEPGVYPLKDLPDTTLDRDKLVRAVDDVKKISEVLLPIFIVFPMFAGLMVYYTLFRGVYLLFVGLVLFIIAKATGVIINFKNSFRIALHAMTLSVVIETLTGALNVQMPADQYWFMGINLITGFLVLWRMEVDKNKVGVLEKKEG